MDNSNLNKVTKTTSNETEQNATKSDIDALFNNEQDENDKNESSLKKK